MAGVLTASKWKAQSYMRQQTRPTNPKTEAQQANRQLMADAINAWRLLTEPEKNIQRALGAASQPPIPGYNFFIKGYISFPPQPVIYYPVGADCFLYHAYWDGSALDHSLSANHGTLNGTPSFGPLGLTFSGAQQYVKNLAPTNISPALNDGTRYVWGNTTDLNTGIVIFLTLTNQGLSDFEYLHLRNDNQPSQFQDQIYLSGQRGYWYPWDNCNALGAWHLFGFHMDRDAGAAVSFDGVFHPAGLKGPLNTTHSQQYTQLFIGGFPDLGGFYHKGTIGEVLAFHSYKDQTALTAYFNATKARYGIT